MTSPGDTPGSWRPPAVDFDARLEPSPAAPQDGTRRRTWAMGAAAAVIVAVLTFAAAFAVLRPTSSTPNDVGTGTGTSSTPTTKNGSTGSSTPTPTITTGPFLAAPMPASPLALDPALCRAALPTPGGLPTDRARITVGSSSPPRPTEGSVAVEIEKIMRQRFRNGDPNAAVARALRLYDDARLREVTLGDPIFRGAIVELIGTIGEPAIAAYLDPAVVDSVQWGTRVDGNDDDVAESEPAHNGALRIFVNESVRREPAAAIAPILFHEVLHADRSNGQEEETIATVLQQRVWLDQIRDLPEVAAIESNLIPQLNLLLVAMLNTRRGDRLTTTSSDATDVLPIDGASRAHVSVADFLTDPAMTSYGKLPSADGPGNAVLTAAMDRLTQGTGRRDPAFDRRTLDDIDQHATSNPCDLAAVADALTMLPPRPQTTDFTTALADARR